MRNYIKILLFILVIVSVPAHAEDLDLRHHFYAMINRPLNPQPRVSINHSENYLVDPSELFWIAINDLVKSTGNYKHSIGTHDFHNPLRSDKIHFISDEDKRFIEDWYNENEYFMTYDLIKDLEEVSRVDKVFAMDYVLSYETILHDYLCSRLIRRKTSLVTTTDKAAADNETVAYFNQNLKTLKNLFKKCDNEYDNADSSLIYSVVLRGDLKLFILIINILTDGAVLYNPDTCIVDRTTMYAVEDWCWINEHKIPYDIIREIRSAYYKDIIYRLVSMPEDYANFTDLLSDCEGITAVKEKIAGLHLTDIRSFLTSQP